MSSSAASGWFSRPCTGGVDLRCARSPIDLGVDRVARAFQAHRTGPEQVRADRWGPDGRVAPQWVSGHDLDLDAQCRGSCAGGRCLPGPYHAIDRALYLTAAFTGLRQGQLRGLLWQHVDFDASRVRAFENVVRGERTTPKSRRGRSAPMARTVARLCSSSVRTQAGPAHDSVVADPLTARPVARTPMTRRYRAASRRPASIRASAFTTCATRLARRWLGRGSR